MSSREGDSANFSNFMQLHRNLLDCYASGGVNPSVYKHMDPATQRDFCYSARTQVEDQLFKQRVRPQDFFKALQSQ